MAKHGRGRKASRFQAIPVDVQIALGALGASIVTSGALTNLGTTKFRVVSTDLTWSLKDKAIGQGPIKVGIFNGDLSNTEVGEALDASPTSMADIVGREQARRPVRSVGQFSAGSTDSVLNDGKPIRQKLVTMLDEGVELEAFARNGDSGTLTTGVLIDIVGFIYGYWA